VRGNKPGEKEEKPGKTYPAEGPNTEKGRTSMSSHDMMNPYGGVPMGRVMEPFDPNDRLLERILSKENMATAWKRVKANHGAPGIDGITIEQSPDHTRELWTGIRKSLLAGTYQPLPVKRVEIPKPTGGTRPLGIPTVLDRLIQQAIAQVLSPIFDPSFSASSFGFRPGRSACRRLHRAGEEPPSGRTGHGKPETLPGTHPQTQDQRGEKPCRHDKSGNLFWFYLKLGTSLQAAISVAISRKGPWHLSRTLATQTGMTNKWLKDQGLLSVKELWVHIINIKLRFHYPATAR